MLDLSAPETTPEALSVLIADDDPIVQEILRNVLATAGAYEVSVVSDTHNAIKEALRRKFDLMLFDRHMPPITGDRAIRAIRSGATPNRLGPIILMTAEIDHVSDGNPARAEPTLYFPKPLNPGALLQCIDRIM